MNEEARRQQSERQEPKAGEFPLERSESGNSPAARPGETRPATIANRAPATSVSTSWLLGDGFDGS